MKEEVFKEEGVFMSRVKIMIRCNHCGEKFILRGNMDQKGKADVGFKKCICDNSVNIEITIIEI